MWRTLQNTPYKKILSHNSHSTHTLKSLHIQHQTLLYTLFTILLLTTSFLNHTSTTLHKHTLLYFILIAVQSILMFAQPPASQFLPANSYHGLIASAHHVLYSTHAHLTHVPENINHGERVSYEHG